MNESDVKVTTRIVIGVVLLAMFGTGGCVADSFVRGNICFQLLGSKDVPDGAKAQVIQSGACMALR